MPCSGSTRTAIEKIGWVKCLEQSMFFIHLQQCFELKKQQFKNMYLMKHYRAHVICIQINVNLNF